MSGENWRDARLKKALDSAPDEAARPAEGVREAILHKARLSAGTAAAPKPAPRRSMPWWQGLATVGTVAFMGIMIWSGRTPPLEEPAVVPPLPEKKSAAPAPAPAVEAPPPVAQAPAPREDRLAAAAKARDSAQARAEQERAQTMKQERRALSEREQAEAKARAMQAERAPMVAVPPPPEMAIPAPPPPPPPPPAMYAPAAPAPAPRPALPPMASAIVAPWPSWTSLRLRSVEGPVQLQRAQLSAEAQHLLTELLARKRAMPARSDPRLPLGGASATVVLEFVDGEESVGKIDLSQNSQLALMLEQAIAAARPEPAASAASR